jgi:hypothetical protein
MELKELMESLGFQGEFETKEKFVEVFNSTYLPIEKADQHPDVRKKLAGQLFGEQYGKLAKATGGKFTKEQLAAKPFGEALEEVVASITGELETVKAKSKEGAAKQVLELQQQLDDLQKSLQDMDRDKKALSGKLEEVEQTANQKVKQYVIGMRRKEIEATLPWKDGMTELEKQGLESYLQNNFRLDADESGNVVVKDKDGHTIPSKTKTGDAATLKDIYLQLGEANNLFKKNNTEPHRGQPAGTPRPQTPDNTGNVPRKMPAMGVPK